MPMYKIKAQEKLNPKGVILFILLKLNIIPQPNQTNMFHWILF